MAALVSGIPSTLHALATGRDVLAATEAAGSILLSSEERRTPLLLAAGPTHAAISLGWGIVLAATLPARPSPAAGALGGAAVALLDLGLVRRRWPRIARLPALPQLADHVTFGLVVAAVLRRRRGAASRARGTRG